MKKQKTKQRISTNDGSPSMGSLGSLFEQAGFAPSETTAAPAGAESASKESASASAAPTTADLKRARFRREKKGRGGKTVTLVENLSLNASELNALLKHLKTALGCGGTVEDDTIVLQGDIVDRVKKWFESS